MQILVLGYLGIILVGTFFLCLPISAKNNGWTPFIDSLLVATSATCVTGLITVDTYIHWTTFGQIVILLLIQIGGLGFMTFVTLFSLALGRRIGLFERGLIAQSAGAFGKGGILRLIKRILIFTFSVEAIGACMLMISFVPDFGAQGVWFALFHSVSAFCNAGFDLMGDKTGKYSSMTAYSGDPIVCLTIPLLIIVGGLGFFVWKDIKDNRFRFRKYELHTKLVLIMTAILVIVPTLVIMLAENDLPWKERVFSSFFTAVTPRTAGFNVLPLSGAGSVKSVTLLLTIILMFIGGSSGSTAGGVKTNTIAVLGLSVISLVRGKRSVECFGRRIDETNVKNAAQFLTIFLTLIVVGAVLLCLFEQGNSLWPDDPEITGITVTESVFEVVSALATVGLTTGVTPQLTLGSQIVLCVLMFLGRAGCMTVMLSWKTPSAPAAELPMEKVRIG